MLENFRLRVFREVALQQHFRRAAEALHISQPAVTQQIKALEDELGAAVFDRSGGRVRLTVAGEALLLRAEESERALSLAMEELAAMEGKLRGRLRVAASTTIAQYLLPGVLAEFARQHPSVALELESANTARVATAVSDGEAMLGLVEGPVHRQQLHVSPWIEDELVLVVAATHAWTQRKIGLAELAEEPLLVRELGSGTREVLEDALAGAGAPPIAPRMELGSTETLLACVEAGLGVGFASRFALQRQLSLHTLAVVPIRGLRVRRPLSLVRPRSPELHGASAAFEEHLQGFARALRRAQTGMKEGANRKG
jgi:LysR family transcriptional regulator, transcriptional activator of the cysJI operon